MPFGSPIAVCGVCAPLCTALFWAAVAAPLCGAVVAALAEAVAGVTAAVAGLTAVEGNPRERRRFRAFCVLCALCARGWEGQARHC